MFMFLFPFFSLLLCSFFRLKELFQAKNGVTTSLIFFFENAKTLSRSDDGKLEEKKEDGLRVICYRQRICHIRLLFRRA